jgi:hypothetical protein
LLMWVEEAPPLLTSNERERDNAFWIASLRSQ